MQLNSLNFDRSVYYTIRQALLDAGFKNGSDELLVNIIDGDLIMHLVNEAEEDDADLDVLAEATILPAVAIMESGETYTPGGLGGTTKNRISYDISVYGKTPSESKEIAEAICQTLRNKITVYDYTMGDPDTVGFPLDGQLIGEFSVQDLRNIRPGVPTLSLLDSVRRDVSFSIVFFED